MISVIICTAEGGDHLVRCLNSLKRQTFKDYETIILGSDCPDELINRYALKQIPCDDYSGDFCKALNKAVADAEGEYIFFTDTECVLSPNTFETLQCAGTDSFLYAKQYIAKGKNLQKISNTLLSCRGKLFKKRRISEKKLKFKGNGSVAGPLFTAQYLDGIKNIEEAGCYMYSSAPPASFFGSGTSSGTEAWKDLIGLLKSSGGIIQKEIYAYLKDLFSDRAACSQELMFITEENIHDCYELNFAAAVPVLKELWAETKNDKDKKAFESLKRYLSKYEDEPFYGILLKALALDAESFRYFTETEDVNNALFLYEQALKFKKQKESGPAGKISSAELNSAAPADNSAGSGNFGMVKINGKWHCYINGAVSSNFSGLAKNEFGWWYFRNGSIDEKYDGFAPKADGWYVIKKGKAVKKADPDAVLKAVEDRVRSELCLKQTEMLAELINTVQEKNTENPPEEIPLS